MSEFPQIVTFYSFKGGVGRSMAVLNTAYALAARGRNVLVLDMDLEAPGLSGFLRRHDELEEVKPQDMVDLVRWARDLPPGAEGADEAADCPSFPPLSDYAVAVNAEKFKRLKPELGEPGRIDVIPVDHERDCYGRLTALDIGSFNRETLVRTGSILRAYLKGQRISLDVPDYYGPNTPRTAPYDYVVVDSRTGVTETGGLCIGPLSDSLVVFTALNDQNVEGTRQFLEEVGVLAARPGAESATEEKKLAAAERLDPKPTLIVASPVPSGELQQKRERLQQLSHAVGNVVLKLSYHPQMALLESIFVRDYREEYLAQEYDRLTYQILKVAGDGPDFDFSRVYATRATSIEEHQMIGDAIRYATAVPGKEARGLLYTILNFLHKPAPSNDEDVFLADRMYRVFLTGLGEMDFLEPISWGRLLVEWTALTEDADLRSLRRDAALACFARVINNERADDSFKANAIYNRGVSYGELGESEKEIADYTAVVDMSDAPADQKASALFNRGVSYGELGESEKEIADYTAVVDMSDAPAEQKAKALCNRGVSYGKLGETEKGIADYNTVVEMSDAPADQKAVALSNRGVRFGKLGDSEKAIADYNAVVEMPDAPAEQKARALINRGVSYGKLGDSEKAIADYSAVVEMSDAPADQRAMALVNRGVRYGKLGESEKAIADYNAVVEMSDAPADQRAMALVNRGLRYGELGETENEIADYNAVVEMSDAPADQKSNALSNRGWCHYVAGEYTRAINDYRDAIAANDDYCNAHGNLAVALLVAGQTDEALAAYDRALALAKPEDVADMENDLNEAIQKHGELSGTDTVAARIARRREELQSESGQEA